MIPIWNNSLHFYLPVEVRHIEHWREAVHLPCSIAKIWREIPGEQLKSFSWEVGTPVRCSPINSYKNPTSSSHFYLNWQWINCLGLSSFKNLKEKNDKTLMVLLLGTEQSIIIKNKWQTWPWQSATRGKVESLKKISLLNFSSTTWVTVVMDNINDSLP